MTKEEMREGLIQGRRLIQEEWSTADEITAVNELAAEGVCTVSPWEYKDGFQCERRVVQGIRQ